MIKRCALDHRVAAGQVFGNAAQVNARKHHLCARRAHIDAHTVQDHIVLAPQRFLRRIVARKIMVVIMISFAIVRVVRVSAVLMVLYAVFVFNVFAAHRGRSIKLVKVHLVHGHFQLNQCFKKRLAHHGGTRKINFHALQTFAKGLSHGIMGKAAQTTVW